MTIKIGQRDRSLTSSIVFFMLCAIPILASILFGAVSTGTLALLSLFFGLLLIVLVFDFWKSGEIRYSTSLLQLPIIGLILIGLFQLLPLGGDQGAAELLKIPPTHSLSLDPTSTKFALVKLTGFLAFFAAALVYINSPQRLRKVVFTIIIFAGIMAFIGIIQRLASPNFIYGMREVDYANPFASYVNQHHFAAFMEMTIGLTLALLFGNSVERDKRLLLIIAIVLMGIAIVLTGSRGGFLSLIGVISFLVLLNISLPVGKKSAHAKPDNGMLKRNLTLIGGSVILVLFLISAVIWLGADDSVRRLGKVTHPDFANGRLHFWDVSLQIFRDNPIIGSGLESFGVAFTKYDTWNGSLRVEQAHNDYLQILSDAGIIGFIFALAFIFLLFKYGLRRIKSSTNLFRRGVAMGALSGCFGILVHSFFDFPLRTNANALFFLLLVVLATVSIKYPKLYRKETSMVQAGGESPELIEGT